MIQAQDGMDAWDEEHQMTKHIWMPSYKWNITFNTFEACKRSIDLK